MFNVARLLGRCLLVALSASAALALGAGPVAAEDGGDGDFQWRPLRVGAGGFITGIDISPDARVALIRADTYGAYLWSESERAWKQIVSEASLPAEDLHPDPSSGVYEIRVAPSDDRRFYMAFRNGIYRSDDMGGHWRRTSFAPTTMDANDEHRTSGPKIAVDPFDSDLVYVGTPEGGLFASADGGGSWTSVAQVPVADAAPDKTYPGMTGLVFDARAGQSGAKAAKLFASSYGHGVFLTTDGGATWRELAGGPRNVVHAKIGADGAYYAAGDDGDDVWRYDDAGWENITPGRELAGKHKQEWCTVAPDPFNPKRIVAGKVDGSIAISDDRGETWRNVTDFGPISRMASDIPWLEWTREVYMTCGDMTFDAKSRDLLWFAEGIGVWQATLRRDAQAGDSLLYESRSLGIEQLVANQILSPPGGKPLLASWDRPVFRRDDVDAFPTQHGPDNRDAIVAGWSLDYAANDSRFIAGVFNWWGVEKSGASQDGGKTWRRFSAYPPSSKAGKIGGSLAVSTAMNMVWAPSGNATPYYTLDGGASWVAATIPDAPKDAETGWGFAYYLNRHIVAADRVKSGVFYLYNDLRGLYRTADGGKSWTLVYRGEIAPFSKFNAKLASVPGRAGELFFTSGTQGGPTDPHPAPNPLMHSLDGGATWTPVPDVQEALTLGFGKGRGDYPAIVLAGYVRGEYGVWRSEDAAKSWKRIGRFPLGILAAVTTVSGDADNPDRVYLGFSGAGYAVGDRRAGSE